MPRGRGDDSIGDPGEGAVALIAIEEVLEVQTAKPVIGDDQVQIAVIVKITPGRAHALANVPQSRRFRNVGKVPVSIVSEKCVGSVSIMRDE